jgi:peptidyl-dipeptidase Dcp
MIFLKERKATAQLRYFLIRPEYSRIVLGDNLMQLLMEFARDLDYTNAYLWSTDELEKAVQHYRKFGFSLSEEKRSYDFGKVLIEQRC